MRILYTENDFKINEKVCFSQNTESTGIISAISIRPNPIGNIFWSYEVTYWNGSQPASVWCNSVDIKKIKTPMPPRSE